MAGGVYFLALLGLGRGVAPPRNRLRVLSRGAREHGALPDSVRLRVPRPVLCSALGAVRLVRGGRGHRGSGSDGLGFRARFPRSAVVSVTEHKQKPLSRGVHGFAGRWLVNGSGQSIVGINLEPRQRGYVLGLPVRLRNLLVSVEEPAGVMAALTR